MAKRDTYLRILSVNKINPSKSKRFFSPLIILLLFCFFFPRIILGSNLANDDAKDFKIEQKKYKLQYNDLKRKIEVEQEELLKLKKRYENLKKQQEALSLSSFEKNVVYYAPFLVFSTIKEAILKFIILFSYFLPGTLIILFLLIFYKKRKFFIKRKISIIIFFIILFFLSVLPVLADQKEIPIERKLKTAMDICSLGDVDKAISLLESKIENIVEIHAVKMPEKYAYLKPILKVRIDSPEYYYTLGCLYLLKGKGANASQSFEHVYSPGLIWESNVQKQSEVLISIIQYFIEVGDFNRAGDALKGTLPMLTDVNELLKLYTYLERAGMGPSCQEVLKRTWLVAHSVQDKILLVTFLLDRKRMEEANKSLSQTIEYFKNDGKALYEIAIFCINKKLYSVAISSLERIIIYHPEAMNKRISFPKFLPESIPRPIVGKQISLLILLGIVCHLQNQEGKAEYAFINGISGDLQHVIRSSGEWLPDDPTPFFYLKWFWEVRGESNKLEMLNPFYEYLLKNYFKKFREENKKLRIKQTNLENEIENLNAIISKLEKKIFIRKLGLLISTIVFLGMIIFSIIVAWNYSRKYRKFKTFVFMGKLLENTGWCICLTFVLFLLGVFFVLIGQLMEIFVIKYQL